MDISEIEQILIKDSHIFKIHNEFYELPNILYENWNIKSREKAKDRIGKIMDYLNTPIIEDGFGYEHDKRREWEKKYPIPVQEILDANPIGINTYQVLYNNLKDLLIGFRKNKNTQLVQQIDNLFSDFPEDTYNTLTTNEKIELAKTTKNRVYQILLTLQS